MFDNDIQVCARRSVRAHTSDDPACANTLTMRALRTSRSWSKDGQHVHNFSAKSLRWTTGARESGLSDALRKCDLDF
jgi:hypothetical protein